jgi:sulfate adenylyltransferase
MKNLSNASSRSATGEGSWTTSRAKKTLFSSETETVSILPHGGTLVDRRLRGDAREAALERAGSLCRVPLPPMSASDIEMIAIGAYSPLTGFMGRADYECVLEEMRLANGLVWSLPITLPVDDDLAANIKEGEEIALVQGDVIVAIMKVTEKFCYDKAREAIKVYQTTEVKHPSVARLYRQGNILLGGNIWLLNWPEPHKFCELRYTPAQTRKTFAEKGWRQIVGFQTRNPLHRAHEYILKHALEMTDGLFLHPLVGETKPDDIPAEARIQSYQALLNNYYPPERVLLGVFPAAMRYAGPREAIFHALCRKNYGCTHFIVGNDHAGVGNYYPPRAACDIFQEFTPEEIGIKPLLYPEIKYYCRRCGGVVTPKICPHKQNHSRVNGTQVREMLNHGKMPPKEIMQPEISQLLMRAVYGRKPIGYLIRHAVQVLKGERRSFIPRLSAAVEDWHHARPEKLSRKIGYHVYQALYGLISKPGSFMRRFSATLIDWPHTRSETKKLKRNPRPNDPRSTK